MLKTIQTHYALHWRSTGVMALFLLGGFVMGQILLLIVLRLIDREATWFPIATLLSLMSGMLCIPILGGHGFLRDCQLALSMGQTRRSQILVCFVDSAADSLLWALLVWALSRLDLRICRTFYAAQAWDAEAVGIIGFLRLPYLLLAALPLTVLKPFVAAILGRFGKRGALSFYFVFLGGSLLFPRIIDASPDLLSRLAAFCAAIPLGGWIAIGSAVLVGLSLLSVRLLLIMAVQLE